MTPVQGQFMRRVKQLRVRACCIGVLLGLLMSADARAEVQRYGSLMVGTLTTDSWHGVLRPWNLSFADSHMIAGSVGWDRPVGASSFRFGAEIQLTGHFGRQDHFELSVPVVLRYVPERGPFIRSAAAGLGLSYATKVPQVEIDRNGASQRMFVHWMAEVEFGAPEPATTTFLRVHHRSDGYGVFDVDAGSTGIMFGVRKRF